MDTVLSLQQIGGECKIALKIGRCQGISRLSGPFFFLCFCFHNFRSAKLKDKSLENDLRN